MGGSLNPNFFKNHINVAVMTGPVACTANIPNKYIRFAAAHIKEIQFLLVRVLKMYNTWAPMPLASEGLAVFCHFYSDLCKTLYGMLHNDGVDNA